MHSFAILHRLKYTELNVTAVSSCSSLLSSLRLDSPWVCTDNVSSGLWSYSFNPASSGDWDHGFMSNTASTEYRTRVNTFSLKNGPLRWDFNLSRNKEKEESFLFVFVVGRARNDSWGWVWCICVYVYMRNSRSRERERERERERKRERDRRSVEEEEKSFLRGKFWTTVCIVFRFSYDDGDGDGNAVERRSCDSTSSSGFMSLSRHIASSPFSKAKGTAYGCFRKWVDTSRSVSIEGRSRDEV